MYDGRADDIHSCTNTLDLIWTIWDKHLDSVFVSYRGYPSEYVRDFDQCVSMTNAALEYGCDIYDTVSYNPSIANALFKTFDDICRPPGREEALKYLLQIGYDMEQRAESGETLLLHAVTAMRPANIERLKFLIEKGANIHAIDAEGRGALHCAFLVPHYRRWDGENSYWEGAPRYMFDEVNWDLEYIEILFDFDDERYAEDYEDLRYDLDPLTRKSRNARYPSRDPLLDSPNQDYMSTINCSMDFSESDFQRTFEPTHLGEECQAYAATSSVDDFQDSTFTEESVACADIFSENEEYYARFENGSDLPKKDFPSRDSILAEETVSCADTSSSTDEHDASSVSTDDEFMHRSREIRRMKEILKERLRWKLLILLQGGCDPDVLDNEGESPGDYAERFGLLPQWEWALINAGYNYDSVNHRWFK